MVAKRWTKREEQALMQGVGAYGIAWFCKNGGNAYDWPNALEGRTVNACYSKARRLFGNGGLSRGSYSVKSIMERTGYSKTQIRRAMKALAQKWKRLSPKGSYLIYEDQYDDLINWLVKDYWSPLHHLYNCLWCHKVDLPHEGKGLCLKCYHRYAHQLNRRGMPIDNDLLLEYIKTNLSEINDLNKIEKQLNRGRALPEHVLFQPKELKCFIGL
jgi:hypothetical protein